MQKAAQVETPSSATVVMVVTRQRQRIEVTRSEGVAGAEVSVQAEEVETLTFFPMAPRWKISSAETSPAASQWDLVTPTSP